MERQVRDSEGVFRTMNRSKRNGQELQNPITSSLQKTLSFLIRLVGTSAGIVFAAFIVVVGGLALYAVIVGFFTKGSTFALFSKIVIIGGAAILALVVILFILLLAIGLSRLLSRTSLDPLPPQIYSGTRLRDTSGESKQLMPPTVIEGSLRDNESPDE